jgi:hypothetical protein
MPVALQEWHSANQVVGKCHPHIYISHHQTFPRSADAVDRDRACRIREIGAPLPPRPP